MPPRLARSSVRTAAPPSARQKNKKRNLNAYAIASHSTPPKKGPLKSHRLGEYIDDRPAPKRRRDSDDDDVAALDEEDMRGAGAKRRKATFEDGDIEEGSDSEGNEWTLGGLAEDDSDSDLDSDEAFGESDEEEGRFEGFTFRGSKKPVRKRVPQREGGGRVDSEGGVNLDEDASESEEEADFGQEGVDLATMLDDDIVNEEDGESGSEDDDSGSTSDSDSADEGSEKSDDEERNARMRDRLEALDGDQQVAKPRQPAQQNTLSVDDLLADLDPSAKKQFAAATKTRKRSERPTTLAAPLPKRQQDKLNREVASQKAKEQLDRWRDTVIQNRRAEFLSFPLKNADEGEPLGKDKFLETKPQNDLEANIQRIMEESGMASKDGGDLENEEDAIMKAEGMAEQKMDVDEVMRRRAELRKTRELLFQEERKAKRIAKIKSKSYRRVHRREKAREAERQREEKLEMGLDPMDDNEREQQDRRRAEERMSTKHRESKWAKQLKQTNRAAWDEGARNSVNEKARRREELRKRVEGKNVDSDSERDDDLDDEDGDGEAFTLRQLDQLRKNDEDGSQRKGLAGMKFMRDADARRKAQNDEDIERMRKEMAVEDGDEVESDAEDIDDQGLGRAIFGPRGGEASQKTRKKQKRPEMEEGSESDGANADEAGDDVEIVTEAPAQDRGSANNKKANGGRNGPLAPSNGRTTNFPRFMQVADDDGETSWLARASKSKMHDEPSDDYDFRPPEAAAPVSATPSAEDENRVAARSSQGVANTNGWAVVRHRDEQDDESNSETEEPPLSLDPHNTAIHRKAFAGDEVEAQFEAAKRAQEASEDEPEETTTHLPGWGSWTGAGLSKSLRKANAAAKAKAKTKHNPLFKTKAPRPVAGVKPTERKDARLPNVIVSEKADRKGKKYLAASLPHGFERKEEYERALRRPMGEEWATKEVVQRNTRPRVVVRKGAVIEAMERSRV